MPEKVNVISFFKTETYRNLFPQIPVLAESDYFLQFNGYEIALPQKTGESDILNIFERSVLKFKALGNLPQEKLTDKLCLQEDLIKFILIRLTELGFLDKSKQITETGREILGENIKATSESIIPYLMLITRDTEEEFPELFSYEIKKEAQLNNSFIEMTFGSTGKAKTLRGYCVFVKEKKPRAQILSQEKIRKVTNYTGMENILSSHSEPIYLHVKAVLQDGNVDYPIVSDGLRIHSNFLCDYLCRQNPKVLLKLKESANKFFETLKDNLAPDKGKYYDIRQLMRKKEIKTENVDDVKNARENEKKEVQNFAKAVEWTLLYHLRKCPPPKQLIQTLCSQTPEENFRTLTDFAERLGLHKALDFPNFFKGISSGMIKTCMTTQDPALVPLLAINIATAARVADSNLPDALKVFPNDDAFGFLQRLDAYGKSIRHENKWSPQKNDTADFLRKNVLKFIQALLPDYSNPALVAADSANASLQKIAAQISIIRVLGEEVFINLPPELQNLMLKISANKIGRQMLPPVEFVTTLSMILEKILRRKLQTLLEKISMSKAQIIERLRRAGKSTDLQTVSEKFYSQACKGESATLGAYTLAYMAALNDEQFKTFTDMKVHELLFKITTYRGHGNNLSLVLSEDELADLRDKTFEAVKFLEG